MIDFAPSEAARAVEGVARKLAAEVLAPAAEALDRDGGFPRVSLEEIAKARLLAVNLPQELGGRAAGVVAYSLAITELARGCAATTVAVCVSNMVAEVVNHFGTPAQRQLHVPQLAAGRHVVGAFALSEAAAGSDAGAMRTRARKTDRGWVLDGGKLWITSGSDAGLFVVWARTEDTPGTRGISAFLVPGDVAGLGRGKPEHKLGLRGSTTVALDFAGVEVPDDALLGERGRGFPVAMMALDGGRIGIASQALGIAGGALDAATQWARDRFGADVPQHVQWALADSATELEAARLLTLRAAWLKETGRPFSQAASMAKLTASERGFAICDRLLALMGEAAQRRGHPVERAFRDIRVTMIYEGTSEVQRVVLSRDIMRRFADDGGRT